MINTAEEHVQQAVAFLRQRALNHPKGEEYAVIAQKLQNLLIQLDTIDRVHAEGVTA